MAGSSNRDSVGSTRCLQAALDQDDNYGGVLATSF